MFFQLLDLIHVQSPCIFFIPWAQREKEAHVVLRTRNRETILLAATAFLGDASISGTHMVPVASPHCHDCQLKTRHIFVDPWHPSLATTPTWISRLPITILRVYIYTHTNALCIQFIYI